jgi:hypothetical protein
MDMDHFCVLTDDFSAFSIMIPPGVTVNMIGFFGVIKFRVPAGGFYIFCSASGFHCIGFSVVWRLAIIVVLVAAFAYFGFIGPETTNN